MRVSPKVALVALLGVAFAAGADETSETSVTVKVGFVSIARVLEEAKQAEVARDRIEQEFQPRDRELLEQQKVLRELEDELIDRAQEMTREQRARHETEIRAIKRDIRRAQDEFREELNLARSKELKDLQRKVVEVIRDLAEAQSYDLIVSDGVVFAGKRVDLTDEVLKRLASEFEQADDE